LFSDIESDFGVNSEPYKAGNIYFQQIPHPKNLLVGRWFNAIEDGYLLGGTGHAPLATLLAVTDGSFTFDVGIVGDYIDTPTGETVSVSGLNLTTEASLSDIADALFTEILSAATQDTYTIDSVIYDAVAGGFKMVWSAVSGTDIIGITNFGVQGIGTDLSGLLALDSSRAANSPSTVVETIEEAMAGIEFADGSFYHVTADKTVVDDTTNSDDLSAWIATRKYLYSAGSTDPAVLAEADSVFNRLSVLKPPRTFGTWSATDDYKAVSAAGRLSSVNFNANNSLITMKFKNLNGTIVDSTMTPSQAQALADQAVNFYSERSGDPMYEEGYTFDKNTWIDVRFWLDWFVDAAQVELYNILKQVPTRVPQTEAGMTALKGAVIGVCRQGIANGGIAGGQLSPALTLDVQQSTGNASFDGVLAEGFLVYAAPIATLSQSDRNLRKVPPIKTWLKGSGAVHSIDMSVTFEN
jgi:hypothetical protein